MREKVADGSLGQIQHIEANISVPVAFKPDLPDWRQTREELPAGGMTPLGVHMLDTIHYIGGDVKRVYAMSRRVSKLLDVDDVTTILFELESGAGAYLATLMAVPNVTTVAALGTAGAVWSEADGAHAFVQKRGEPYRTEVPITTVDTIQDEIVEFANCIRTGDEPETGSKEGLAVTEVFEAILRSIEDDSPIDVR